MVGILHHPFKIQLHKKTYIVKNQFASSVIKKFKAIKNLIISKNKKYTLLKTNIYCKYRTQIYIFNKMLYK